MKLNIFFLKPRAPRADRQIRTKRLVDYAHSATSVLRHRSTAHLLSFVLYFYASAEETTGFFFNSFFINDVLPRPRAGMLTCAHAALESKVDAS